MRISDWSSDVCSSDLTELRIAGMQASPDGSMLAILLPSLELDLPDQVWLYRVADRKWSAATPKPHLQVLHPDGPVAATQALAWQGNTPSAPAASWTHADADHAGPTVVSAGRLDDSRRVQKTQGAIYYIHNEENRCHAG